MKNNVFYGCFTPEQAVLREWKCKEDARMVKEIESPVVLLQKENAFVDEDEEPAFTFMDDVSLQQKQQRRHMERGRLNVSKRKR